MRQCGIIDSQYIQLAEFIRRIDFLQVTWSTKSWAQAEFFYSTQRIDLLFAEADSFNDLNFPEESPLLNCEIIVITDKPYIYWKKKPSSIVTTISRPITFDKLITALEEYITRSEP